MAGLMDAIIVPFSAVGISDSVNILIDQNGTYHVYILTTYNFLRSYYFSLLVSGVYCPFFFSSKYSNIPRYPTDSFYERKNYGIWDAICEGWGSGRPFTPSFRPQSTGEKLLFIRTGTLHYTTLHYTALFSTTSIMYLSKSQYHLIS